MAHEAKNLLKYIPRDFLMHRKTIKFNDHFPVKVISYYHGIFEPR
jgi:hypothetical protein